MITLTIGLCGDLKFGRTVHSLIQAMVRYPNVRFVMISPDELKIPDYLRKDTLDAGNIPYKEVGVLEDVLPELDILYMTRVQRERFFNEEDYIRLKDSFILDNKKMKLAPKDMLVLHPLPRVNEIATEVDEDPRAVYFKQVQYGVYVRMALIMTLLEVDPCMLNIGGLKEGVVIDHIKAGGAMEIYNYLGLENLDCSVAIIKNAKSNKMGKKDIIKIEGPITVNLEVLGVLDENITINVIQDNKIVEKKALPLPEVVTNVIKCKNPRCITSIEQELPHRFKLTDKKNRIYRCMYCEQKFSRRH